MGKTIDFDKNYGTATGATLVTNINDAITAANPGDILLFNSEVYDFEGKGFVLSKGITISGKTPQATSSNTSGAFEVFTSFINLKLLTMTSSNIEIAHLKLESIQNNGYVFTRFSHPNYSTKNEAVFYTNCRIHNVIYVGGDVQVFGENGAGVTFENVTFSNYGNGGYYCNRKNRVDYCPQVIVKKCKFSPNIEKIDYNVRGISIDAGNDEYPLIWDQSKMIIEDNYFDGSGIAFSKGKNAIIRNNHFLGYRKDVDMIHMEEYTNNILIDNNIFEFVKPSRCFFIDREGQPSFNITITNNRFVGKYFWVVWSNGPVGVTIDNNDFTKASASDPNYKTFDFSYNKHSEEFPFLLPTEKLLIRNNKGLETEDKGVLSFNTVKGDDSNVIDGFAKNKIQITSLDTKPHAVIDTDKLYYIQNKFTGEKVMAQPNESKVLLSTKQVNDGSDVWSVKFKYPYSYTFLNIKTNKYLEIKSGYTLGEFNKAVHESIFVEQISDYKNKTALPHFALRELKQEGKTYYQLAPGGNEKKTRLIKDENRIKIELATEKGAGNFIAPTNASIWELREKQ